MTTWIPANDRAVAVLAARCYDCTQYGLPVDAPCSTCGSQDQAGRR